MRVAAARHLGSVLGVLAVGMAVFAGPSFGQERAPLSLDDLSATREKPLFSPTRRPLVALAPVAASEPKEGPIVEESGTPYVLAGIIASVGAITVLLRDPKTGGFIKVRSGERIGPWQVVATSNYSARLQNEKRRVELEIFSQ